MKNFKDKLKNIREFQKINSKNTIRTINTTRTNYTNNYTEIVDSNNYQRNFFKSTKISK